MAVPEAVPEAVPAGVPGRGFRRCAAAASPCPPGAEAAPFPAPSDPVGLTPTAILAPPPPFLHPKRTLLGRARPSPCPARTFLVPEAA